MATKLKMGAVCGHCNSEFVPSYKQAWRSQRQGTNVFCSTICRLSFSSKIQSKPTPIHGPCPTCGNKFASRRAKIYCSLTCYAASSQYMSVQIAALKAAPRKKEYPKGKLCPHCKSEFFVNCSNRHKIYCSNMCRRLYYAARFDRWIASPETLALPQAYDEFLTQDELPCLVAGCSWVGKNLSVHMNVIHGVAAAEFKRAAGFNQTTGVVGRSTHETLSNRPNHFVAPPAGVQPPWLAGHNSVRTKSLEGTEHARKARLLTVGEGSTPTRTCLNCGKSFQQSTPYGAAKFCSVDCRTASYVKRQRKTDIIVACGCCGNDFTASYGQRRRLKRNLRVYCSLACRQRANAYTGHHKGANQFVCESS
jgi:hypothetical protein